jgi:hypothetical protein
VTILQGQQNAANHAEEMEDEKKPTVAECQVLESSNNHQSALQGISTRLSEGSAKCFIQNEERSTGSQYLFVPSQVLG